MEKSLFEQMGGTYTQVGDYLLPNLILPEQQDQPLGVWGQRHARYLKQHHKIIYIEKIVNESLTFHGMVLQHYPISFLDQVCYFIGIFFFKG